MADDDAGPGLNLGRKVGPLPLYGWVIAAGGVGLVIFKLMGGKSASTKGSSPGQGTQFNSSTTQTGVDANGNQISTNYTASGDGFLPGMLTTGAGPMPVSGGDIYINTQVPTNTPTPPPPSGTTVKEQGWPEAYGHWEIDAIQKLVGTGGYTQAIVDDVKAAYNAEVAKNGKAIADVQHYSYIGPGNVQAIPRNVTAQQQISSGLPSNPVWGIPAPQAMQGLTLDSDGNPVGNPTVTTPGGPISSGTVVTAGK